MKKNGLIVILVAVLLVAGAMADETNAWVMRRQETDNVLVQKQPGRQPYEYSRFIDNDPPCGAALLLTGEKKGHWLKCKCLYLDGEPEGWIHDGFVVYTEPQKCGRIATVTSPTTATESIGGRDAWDCVRGEVVKVLYWSEEYCTTIWGFLPTSVLDFADVGKEVTQPRMSLWKDWTKRDHVLCVIDWGL